MKHSQPNAPHLQSAAPVLVFALVAGLAMGCASDDAARQPTQPWNQSFVTEASASFASQMSHLYTTCYKDPSFAGERSAYGETLDTLRTLREESAGLHAELVDGKGYEQTLTRYERIKELVRDAQESGAWQFVPEDLSKAAKAALATSSQLDGYYGAR